MFAVMTAGLFPILHLGRPWKFFWLIPYPNWRLIWPQFKSPLVWDVFAILTYLTVSATFLFIGLIPDIAVLRDRETNPVRKQIFGVLSFGWRNSDREWRHFARAYLFLAAFSTPLVLSVHSVVSFDFAMAQSSGLAHDDLPAVLRCGRDLLRHRDGLHDHHPAASLVQAQALRHDQHLDAAAKLCLFTSLVVGCAYLTEFFIAWYSGSEIEQSYFWNRVFGQWWWAAWIMLTCNMILPLLALLAAAAPQHDLAVHALDLHQPRHVVRAVRDRRAVAVARVRAVAVDGYAPTWVDCAILLGSFGWFSMWFLLFIKQLPVIAIAEVKEIVPPKMRHAHARSRIPEGHSIAPGLIGSYEVR